MGIAHLTTTFDNEFYKIESFEKLTGFRFDKTMSVRRGRGPKYYFLPFKMRLLYFICIKSGRPGEKSLSNTSRTPPQSQPPPLLTTK